MFHACPQYFGLSASQILKSIAVLGTGAIVRKALLAPSTNQVELHKRSGAVKLAPL
jgi:hypothetical protein